MNAHFILLARYNAWATARLLGSVAALSEADYRRDAGLFFKSIHGTLNHLLVGEHRLWFVRFSEGTSPRVALDAELEPDRARLDARLREGAARCHELPFGLPRKGAVCGVARACKVPTLLRAGALHPAPLRGNAIPFHSVNRPCTTMRGTAASLPFAATLAHVFNHGTHHRGQITAVLTALGRPCPELDFVYYLQNPSQP